MRDQAGAFLQLLGLVLLPYAVWHGLRGGDVFVELLIATGGLACILVGRSLRLPPR